MKYDLPSLLALKKKAASASLDRELDTSLSEGSLPTFPEVRAMLDRPDTPLLAVSAIFADMVREGQTKTLIAEQVGRSVSYVTNYLELQSLPFYLHQLVLNKQVRDPATIVLLKKLFAVAPKKAEALIQNVLDQYDSITRTAARRLLDDQTRGRETKPQKLFYDTMRPSEGAPEDEATSTRFAKDPYWDALPIFQPDAEYRAFSRLDRRHIVVEWVDADDQLRSGYLTPNWVSNDPNVVCVTSQGMRCAVKVSQLTISAIIPSSEVDLEGLTRHQTLSS